MIGRVILFVSVLQQQRRPGNNSTALIDLSWQPYLAVFCRSALVSKTLLWRHEVPVIRMFDNGNLKQYCAKVLPGKWTQPTSWR